MAKTRERAADLLPLRPVEFQILLSLSQGERHGYRIIQDAEERGEGAAVPGMATLYRALRRLEREALIERSSVAGQDEDARRRTYRLTDAGRHVARLEARRLAILVAAAEGSLLDGEVGR